MLFVLVNMLPRAPLSCPTQRSTRWLIFGLGCVLLAPAGLAGQTRSAPPERPNAPRTTWGTPDLQGVWSTSTLTPFERPAAFEGQEFLTEEEAAEFAERVVTVRNTDVRSEGVSDVTSAYNNHWYDWGTRFVSTRRTSLVIDPPTGRVPALTAEGKERVAGSIPIFWFQDGRNPRVMAGARSVGALHHAGCAERDVAHGLQQPLPNLPDARATSTAAGAGQPRVCRADGRRLGHRRPLRSPPVVGGRWPVEHDALRVDEVLSRGWRSPERKHESTAGCNAYPSPSAPRSPAHTRSTSSS